MQRPFCPRCWEAVVNHHFPVRAVEVEAENVFATVRKYRSIQYVVEGEDVAIKCLFLVNGLPDFSAGIAHLTASTLRLGKNGT